MKKTAVLLLTLAMILSLTACSTKTVSTISSQASSAASSEPVVSSISSSIPEEPVDEYVKGDMGDTAWQSEWMGIRWDAPEGYLFLSEEEINRAFNLGAAELDLSGSLAEQAMEVIVPEFVAMDSKNPTANVNLLTQASPPLLTEETIFRIIQGQLSDMQITINSDDTYKMDVGGIVFTAVDYEASAGGQTLSQTLAICQKGSRLILMTLTYTDAADQEKMLSAFSPLQHNLR